MMFERFTGQARAVVVQSQDYARGLGHNYIGCEHLLLALANTDAPAGAVLREHGITPERVNEQIVRQVGLGAGAGLFADLDRDALASIGIDLDAVRARIEARFGPDPLIRAAQAAQRRRSGRVGRLRRWRRRRRARRLAPLMLSTPPPARASGKYSFAGPEPRGHIPFTPRAKKVLAHSLREAVARHDQYIGVEHIALGLLGMQDGLVQPVLSALGTSAPALRAAVADRYRRAG